MTIGGAAPSHFTRAVLAIQRRAHSTPEFSGPEIMSACNIVETPDDEREYRAHSRFMKLVRVLICTLSTAFARTLRTRLLRLFSRLRQDESDCSTCTRVNLFYLSYLIVS